MDAESSSIFWILPKSLCRGWWILELLWLTIFLLQDVCGSITQTWKWIYGGLPEYLKIYNSTSSAHFFVQRSQVVQWQYLDLELLPNAMIHHNIPSLMSTRLIYVYQGELSVSGTVIPSSTVASLEGDDIFEARAGNLECFFKISHKS